MLYSGETCNVTWSSYLVTIKCSVSDLCGHFCEARGRSERLSLCGWITGTEEQKSSRVGTMRTFFPWYLWSQRPGAPLWWELCADSPVIHFEAIPSAHTGYTIHSCRGSLKGTQSPFSELKKRKKEQIVLPGAFGLETKKALFLGLWHSWMKAPQQKRVESSNSRLPSKPEPQFSMTARGASTNPYVPSMSTLSESSKVQ